MSEAETSEQQVERLSAFILSEVPGEPSQSEGAVDTAMRLLRELVNRWEIDQMYRDPVRQEFHYHYPIDRESARD